HHDLDRYFRLKNSSQLLDVHLKAPVPDNSYYLSVRAAQFSPYGGWKCKAHGTEPSGGDLASGGLELGVAAGYHLMLAHIRDYYGLPFGTGVNLFYDLSHFYFCTSRLEVV